MSFKKLAAGLLTGALLASSFIMHDVQALSLFKTKDKFESKKLVIKPTPKNTVIAFDMHGVLMNWDWAAFGKTMFKHAAVTAGLGYLSYQAFGAYQYGIAARLAPMLMVPLVSLYARVIIDKPVGYVYDYPVLNWFKHDFVKFAGSYKPNFETFEIIKKLKGAGYKVILASNVDPDSLVDLKSRFPQLKEFDAEICPGSKNDWLDKHYPQEYFGKLKADSGLADDGKQVVFIDDKVKNCRRAQDNSIDSALHFTTAGQLIEDLKKLGIVVK